MDLSDGANRETDPVNRPNDSIGSSFELNSLLAARDFQFLV